MHANPQRLPFEEPGQLPTLRPIPPGPKLEQPMLHFFRLLRLAFWRAFVHDAFATAKASAYSSILTFFLVLLIIGSDRMCSLCFTSSDSCDWPSGVPLSTTPSPLPRRRPILRFSLSSPSC